jgi:UDP-glucose 4-epimerase
VLEVIAAVKKASGCDFPVSNSARRPGDAAAIVAASSKIRNLLGWGPQHDDLDGIVRDALAWEGHLARFKAAS